MRSQSLAVLFIVPLCISWSNAQSAEQGQFIECVKSFTAEGRYNVIAAKLPLADFNQITFNMLADQSKPTPQEQESIAEWFDRRDACWKNTAESRSNWPADFVQLAEQGNTGIKEIGVDLYNRKINYGEANKRFQELGNAMKAKVAELLKQYQAQTATLQAQAAEKAERQRQFAEQQLAQRQQYEEAQERQEQAVRQQRAQAFLGLIQQQQIRQQQIQQQQLQQFAPRPTYNTECNTVGSSTNCTTH